MAVRQPSTLRKKYGDELRRRRLAAGMTQEQLALEVVCSPTLISHFEAGRRLPNPDDAKRIDRALNTDGWFSRWLEDLNQRYADHFAEAAELQQQATEIRQFSGLLIPGLLQTEAYARAVFQTFQPNYQPEVVDQQVVNRMERGRILEDAQAPVLWAVLDEGALRRRVGGGRAMAEQLRKVADLAESGRLRLHVLPFSVGAHALLEGMLMLMSFADAAPVAYAEGVLSGHLLDDPALLARCHAAYDVALSDALPQRESLALTRAIAEEHDEP
ncbi:helix-turn-helix transcriptional regulator [Streptomyces sp. NBRC 109706]|uniref:helix-turn-helix domain-containing protein n=1 Tax=Streptomyces sp. NBRC 109706 TaxID=1550035 RepID=UPI00078403A9|nr:helix-turn-helix transcriptional regulator [Streptomyces sp. NBRC 109706]